MELTAPPLEWQTRAVICLATGSKPLDHSTTTTTTTAPGQSLHRAVSMGRWVKVGLTVGRAPAELLPQVLICMIGLAGPARPFSREPSSPPPPPRPHSPDDLRPRATLLNQVYRAYIWRSLISTSPRWGRFERSPSQHWTISCQHSLSNWGSRSGRTPRRTEFHSWSRV